jgi:hypothetical protein
MFLVKEWIGFIQWWTLIKILDTDGKRENEKWERQRKTAIEWKRKTDRDRERQSGKDKGR